MEMVLQAVQSVLSMIVLMLVGGWLAGKPWFRDNGGSGMLSKLIVQVFVPCYMLTNVLNKVGTRENLVQILASFPIPLATVLLGLVLGLGAAKALGIKAPRRGVFINVMTFTNCVFIGFPIVTSLFGDEAAAAGMVYYMANTTCFWTIGVSLLREDGGHEEPIFSKAGLKKLVSPPLMGFFAGVVMVVLGLGLHPVLAGPIGQLGAMATPLAMVFVGCILRNADWKKLRLSRDLVLVVLFRFVICPALVLVLVRLLPIPQLYRRVFFIMSAMPAMTQLSVMCKESGSDVEFASLLIAVTTVLSIFLIPVYTVVVTLLL